jgi:hypothetical protein
MVANSLKLTFIEAQHEQQTIVLFLLHKINYKNNENTSNTMKEKAK